MQVLCQCLADVEKQLGYFFSKACRSLQRLLVVIFSGVVTLCRGGRTLFHGLSFDLGPGDRLAVMGGSGTGKPSLLQALLGRAQWGGEVGRGGRLPAVTRVRIQIGGIPHTQWRDWVGW